MSKDETWSVETLHPDVRVSYRADRVVFHEETAHQRLELIENPTFGTLMLLDGVVQVTTADEFIYHEMLAHVPILAHGQARSVLIVGGGDCGLAEEVLKHAIVERLAQVEIDADVVAFARTHFGAFNAGVFQDPRFDLRIGDGAAFVAETDERFDVILVDSTDPDGPGAVLFTPEFYDGVRRCLAPGGVVVTQSGVPFLQRDGFVTALRALSGSFAVTSAYVAAIPSYFGGHMAFGWGSQDRAGLEVDLATLAERFGALDTRYYTPQVHKGAFALPRFIAQALSQAQEGLRTG